MQLCRYDFWLIAVRPATFIMLKELTSSEENGANRRIGGKEWLIAGLLAALVVILGAQLIVTGVTAVDHDDGIYVLTAKAISEGEGYRLIHLPDAPAQTKYPPLYPAVLAIIWKLFPGFPGNLLLMQWATLLSGAAAAAVTYLYAIRFGCCSRLIAAASVILCVTAPRYLFLSTICMSDMPFALVLVLDMWALSRHLESPVPSRKAQFLLGILLALPFLLRSIGFVVVVVVFYLAIRHKKIMRWPVIGICLPVIPYMIWLLKFSIWQNSTTNNSYYTNYVSWWHSYGVPLWGQILKWNAFNILQAANHIHFSRWHFRLEWVSWLAALLGFLGLIYIIRRCGDRHVLTKILVGYLAILMIWPWPPFRFLMPILSFFYCYMFAAVIDLLKSKRWILKPLLAVMFFVPLIGNADSFKSDLLIGRSNHYPGYMLRVMQSASVKWSGFQEMFNWIKQNTRPGDLFISGIDPMLYLYTNRRGIRPFASRPSSMYYGNPEPVLGPMEEIIQNIRHYKPQYLIFSPMPGLTEEFPYAQFVVESQKQYPGWIRLVYTGEDKRFSVWEIRDGF